MEVFIESCSSFDGAINLSINLLEIIAQTGKCEQLVTFLESRIGNEEYLNYRIESTRTEI